MKKKWRSKYFIGEGGIDFLFPVLSKNKKQRENIKAFIDGSREIGVPDIYNFDTSDLFEEKNMRQVEEEEEEEKEGEEEEGGGGGGGGGRRRRRRRRRTRRRKKK